jgi:methanogenic corrinoid protein MtbC1
LEAENVSASSSEISKGNESSGLFTAIYRSFERSWRQKREWKILMATVKGDVHDIEKYCSCRLVVIL